MSELTGTGQLTRLALRRDRVLLPGWIAVFVFGVVSSSYATVDLYPTEASRVSAASAVNDVPSIVALYGRVWDPTSLGALATFKMSGVVAALLAVFATILVVRHTRAEEESGRLEMLGATVVGRRASLTAALLLVFGTMLVVGGLTAIGQIAAGLPASGSWAFGLSWTLTGMVFACVAAATAQLTISARSANGLALAFLAIAYILRGVGDVRGGAGGPAFWSWLSPIGWGQQVRPYAGDRWWVFLLPAVFCVVATWVAFRFASRRDLAAGLFPDRVGRSTGSRWLASPLGLAWRQQRGVLAAWAVGYVVLGYLLGTVASDVGSLLDSEQAREMIAKLGGTHVLTDAFFAAEFGIAAFITTAYGISAVMRLHTEESSGRAEPILSCPVPRTRWLASHTLIAVVGTTVLTLLLGVTAATANAFQQGTSDRMGSIIGAAFVQLPAVWIFAALTVAVFGVMPRFALAGWAVLVGFVLVQELGTLWNLPHWVLSTSPFDHTPSLPGSEMAWTPVGVMVLCSGCLVVIGAVAFRRRDIATH